MHTGKGLAFIVLFAVMLLVHCKPVQVPKDKEANQAQKDWRKEEDPAYVKYLKQVIEILEEDENFAKKLENVTEEDIRTGKIAEEIDFASHHIRTRLDELKRKEIESQRQLLRKQEDVRRGIHREYWNPLNDRDNPHTFEVDDLKKLLAKVIINKLFYEVWHAFLVTWLHVTYAEKGMPHSVVKTCLGARAMQTLQHIG